VVRSTFCNCAEHPFNELPTRFMKNQVLNNRFVNNVVTGRNTSTLVLLDGTTEGVVTGNCFIDNTVISVDGALSLASLIDTEQVGEDAGVIVTNNYASGNTVTGEVACNGQAIYDIPADVVFDNVTSLYFDLKSCGPLDASECPIVAVSTPAPTPDSTPIRDAQPTTAPTSGTTIINRYGLSVLLAAMVVLIMWA
jgi:hypothetical protein